jgi:small-conductance mechanosensitive channel
MKWRERIQLNALLVFLAMLFASVGLGFTAWAVYLALSARFSADAAALLTAAVFLALLMLTLLAALILNRVHPHHAQRSEEGRIEGLEDLLQLGVDPEVSRWIKANPAAAIALGLVAGVVASYSGSTRSLLKDLIESAAERRSSRR